MKKYIPIIVVVAILIIGGAYYFFRDTAERPADTQVAEYTNQTAGFSFEYRTAPDGYVVLDQLAAATSTDPNVSALVTLIQEEDLAALQGGTVPGETPPTLNVIVLNNPDRLSLQEWTQAQSGFGDLGALFEGAPKVTLDGYEGIRFASDGLYATQNVIVAAEDRVFVLMGAYIDMESALYRDFDAMLVDSFDIR